MLTEIDQAVKVIQNYCAKHVDDEGINCNKCPLYVVCFENVMPYNLPVKKEFLDDENMLICPKCGTKFSIGEWNRKTLDSFGDDITPIILEDFDEEEKIPRECNSYVCDYVCPHCGEEINGKDLILDR